MQRNSVKKAKGLVALECGDLHRFSPWRLDATLLGMAASSRNYCDRSLWPKRRQGGALQKMTILQWLKNLGGRTVESSPHSLDDDPDVDPFNPFPEPIELEITDVIDLHTIPPRDVKRVVEEYLLQAHDAGFRSVRIIHGKGIGVQREMVRKILERASFVAAWSDAPPDAGGLGATIAHFK